MRPVNKGIFALYLITSLTACLSLYTNYIHRNEMNLLEQIHLMQLASKVQLSLPSALVCHSHQLGRPPLEGFFCLASCAWLRMMAGAVVLKNLGSGCSSLCLTQPGNICTAPPGAISGICTAAGATAPNILSAELQHADTSPDFKGPQHGANTLPAVYNPF